MRITLYLLTEGAKLSKEVLRDATKYSEVALSSTTGISWKLFISAGASRKSKWTESVSPIVVDKSKLDVAHTQSSSGILLVRANKRIFAVTFGYGYHAVDSSQIQAGFGLRVTANIILSDGVVSADTKGFNRGSRSQKTIMPAADEMTALGIETSDEWVRNLSGKVSEPKFATTATGADSLRLSIKDFSMTELPGKLKQILRYYKSDDYKANFGFLDNFIRLEQKDPLVEKLDKEVKALVRTKDSSIGFAAPDPFEQKDVHNYKFTFRKSVTTEDLTLDAVYDILDSFGDSVDLLRKVHIYALDEEGQPIDKRYDLYDYVQAELNLEGARYALTSGAWFRIDKDYLKEINDYVASIDDITDTIKLPPWNKAKLDKDPSDKTAEGSYNKAVAKKFKYENLDKDNLQLGRYDKIEICDLLTAEKKLVCVKSAAKSSTLSHLFAQASVSASLMHHPLYKERILTHLKNLGLPMDYGKPSDWTFVYAIAIDKSEPLRESLFFFSKVNLVTHARAIESRGFKVALAKIEMVSP